MINSDLAKLYLCKNGTSSGKNSHSGIRYLPYVFTVQAVSMLENAFSKFDTLSN